MKHGTITGYRYHRCRCLECTRAHREYQTKLRSRLTERAKDSPENIPHGRGGYVNWNCRCEVCTDAQAAYSRELYHRRKAQ